MESIYSKKAVTAILDRHSVAPLKKLGQNFLIDENIVEKIARSAACENVLEIGPGMGALTQKLAACAKRVAAVEIDSGMTEVLKETLSGAKNVAVLNADILKTDLSELSKAYFQGESFAVAGNLPYYITAKCLMHVLDSGAPVSCFTAMVQKEVADRLAARPGDPDYGAITASVRYYGEVEKLFGVSSNCFYPRPDVESAVIRICPHPAFDVDRSAYSKAVKISFAMRRKTLLNNFKAGLSVSADKAAELLSRAGIDPAARAETLDAVDFARLAKILTGPAPDES